MILLRNEVKSLMTVFVLKTGIGIILEMQKK